VRTINDVRALLRLVDVDHPNAPTDIRERLAYALDVVDDVERVIGEVCEEMGAEDTAWLKDARRLLGHKPT